MFLLMKPMAVMLVHHCFLQLFRMFSGILEGELRQVVTLFLTVFPTVDKER